MTNLAKVSRWLNHRLLGGRRGHMFCTRMYMAHNKRTVALLDILLGDNHCQECFYDDFEKISSELEDETEES